MKKSNPSLEQIIDWSFKVGKILEGFYLKPINSSRTLYKGSLGVATEADILAEYYLFKKIKKYFPHHHILSEEDAYLRKIKLENVSVKNDLWLIDPLDGTNNFINRLGFFCVSIGFMSKGKMKLGVVYNPITKELFYAQKGKGAYYSRGKTSQRLRSQNTKKALVDCLVSPSLHKGSMADQLPNVRAIRRLGSAALELCYVASGFLDAYWEKQLKPWDTAAGSLICQEAGVDVFTLNGSLYEPFEPSILAVRKNISKDLASFLLR